MSKTYTISNASLRVDPLETNLVCGWNMMPNGGKMIDLSDSGMDGDIFTEGVYHKFSVLHKTDRSFSLYVDDILQGTVVDDTYNESTFFVIRLSTGDKISLGSLNNDYSILKRLTS